MFNGSLKRNALERHKTVRGGGIWPTATIATTFGTASTGTAISALSGVAATNAALTWLGGGRRQSGVVAG